MKITQKDIIKYRRMSANKWHDEAWHSYMGSKKAEAIGYAEATKEPGDTYQDISRKAENYGNKV